MNRNRIYLIVTAVLWVVLAAGLAVTAIRIYLAGLAVWEVGDALAYIYTRERAVSALAKFVPVFCAAVGMSAAGMILGIRWDGKRKPEKVDVQSSGLSKSHVNTVRGVVLAAAVVMIIAGIVNGSWMDVLIKAINLCTECVGLG